MRRHDGRARRSGGMCAGDRNYPFLNFFFERDKCGRILDGRLVRFLPRFLGFAREYGFYPRGCKSVASLHAVTARDRVTMADGHGALAFSDIY